MQKKQSREKPRIARVNPGMTVRFMLALLATFGSVALAWELLFSQAHVSAFGVNEYATTTQPWGIAFDDKNGYAWIAEPGCDAFPVCSSLPPGLIGRYSINDPGVGEKDYIPRSGQYNPVFIKADKNRNVWFTDPTHNLIGELVPKGNNWASWPVPTANAAPYNLVFDRFGHIWFTEYDAGNVASYNPTTHQIIENPIPTANSIPYGITIDRLGRIWFAESANHQIGSFLPTKSGKLAPGAINEYAVSTSASPHELAIDAGGNVWYSEGSSGQVGVFFPASSTYKEYAVSSSICPTPTPNTTPIPCTGTFVAGINLDTNGLVWFDDALTTQIGSLDPRTGTVTRTQLPVQGSYPYDGLAIDKMNNVWFTELHNNKLGQIPPSSSMTPTPTGSTVATHTSK